MRRESTQRSTVDAAIRKLYCSQKEEVTHHEVDHWIVEEWTVDSIADCKCRKAHKDNGNPNKLGCRIETLPWVGDSLDEIEADPANREQNREDEGHGLKGIGLLFSWFTLTWTWRLNQVGRRYGETGDILADLKLQVSLFHKETWTGLLLLKDVMHMWALLSCDQFQFIHERVRPIGQKIIGDGYPAHALSGKECVFHHPCIALFTEINNSCPMLINQNLLGEVYYT
jgi:hypothetical protein